MTKKKPNKIYKVYNDNLNTKFWTDFKLKPNIKIKLLLIARYFYKYTNLKAPIHDIIFTGSSAGFNWSTKSDIDIHIIIDFLDVSDDYKLVTDYTYRLRNDWKSLYKNIKIYDHPVEVYLEDIQNPVKSKAIYSLKLDKWICKPKKEKISIDKDYILKKYNKWVIQINDAIKRKNIDELNCIIDKVYKDRYNALKQSGEFDNDNIVFKLLRHAGQLDKIKSNIRKITINKLSI